MCLRPVTITRFDPVTHVTRVDVVPCGKCIECLKRKQSDYAFLSKRQAARSGSLHFLTLTYRNNTIGFTGQLQLIDKTSGEIVDRSKPYPIRDEYLTQLRYDYFYVYGDGSCGWQFDVPTYYVLPDLEPYEKVGTYSGKIYHLMKDPVSVFEKFDYDRFDVRCVATPSVCREHVKKWLKSSRQAYKREYGHYPSFKYLEIQEYGPNTHRPHVHILFYGCSDDVAEFFADRWRVEYGRVDLETVRPRKGDSLQQAHEKVSRYLAKYLCKGMFEETFVKERCVERPRRVSSRALGTENLDDLRSYVLAFDVFGEYDPDKPPKAVVAPDGLAILLDRLYTREYGSDGQLRRYRIPKCIVDKIYSKLYGLSKDARKELGFCRSQDSSFVFRLSHSRTLLSRKLSAYKKALYQDRVDKDVAFASRQKTLGPSSLAFRSAYDQISSLVSSKRTQAASIAWKQLRDFYQSSVY